MSSVSLETQEEASELSTIDVLQGKCPMLHVLWHPQVSLSHVPHFSIIGAADHSNLLSDASPALSFSTPTDISFERNQAPLSLPQPTLTVPLPRRYLRCAPAQLQSHPSLWECSFDHPPLRQLHDAVCLSSFATSSLEFIGQPDISSGPLYR